MTDKGLPTPQDFLLKTPIYQKILFALNQIWEVFDLIYFNGTYDSYCIECRRDSTFQVLAPERPGNHVRNLTQEAFAKARGQHVFIPKIDPGIYKVQAMCTRVNTHSQYFLFLIDLYLAPQVIKKQAPTKPSPKLEEIPFDTLPRHIQEKFKPEPMYTIQKVGQHPSYGDLNLPAFKKYSTILDESKIRELNRAVGLASHDVGIGAYVYLRRVFESLIEEAHQLCASDKDWDDEAYIKSRIAERIVLLSQHLPDFLVENRKMYSLLSRGIHELSEGECLSHFDVLRIGIELILDEKLERKEKERKIRQAKSELSKAVAETTKNTTKI